jgi:hypothetical protein
MVSVMKKAAMRPGSVPVTVPLTIPRDAESAVMESLRATLAAAIP